MSLIKLLNQAKFWLVNDRLKHEYVANYKDI